MPEPSGWACPMIICFVGVAGNVVYSNGYSNVSRYALVWHHTAQSISFRLQALAFFAIGSTVGHLVLCFILVALLFALVVSSLVPCFGHVA